MEGMEDLRHIQHLVESSSSSSASSASDSSGFAGRVVLKSADVADPHQLFNHQAQHQHDHVERPVTGRLNGKEDEIRAYKGTTTDSITSLRILLDRIPITPVLNGGATESHPRVPRGGGMLDLDPELELKQEDTVCQAIICLHRNSVQGAPVVDDDDSIASNASVTGGFKDREMGFLHLSALILWCLEEINKTCLESGSTTCSTGNFFYVLQRQAPDVAQTKMIELAAKSLVLWEPFFPVNTEETLLHVLLLLAKHPRLSVVPVTRPRSSSSSRQIITYICQKAVVQLLLQSSGLNWFDQIADKRLSDFRFKVTRRNVVCIEGEQSVADAFHTLWINEADALPVVAERNGGNRKLIGSLTRNHVCLLLEDDHLFNSRRKITVNDFMRMAKEARKTLQRPVTTNQVSDSLKQAMTNMISADTGVSFLVEADEAGNEVVIGSVTLKDVIVQFSPPTSDSSVAGFDFMESALEDSGCRIQNGVMVCEFGHRDSGNK